MTSVGADALELDGGALERLVDVRPVHVVARALSRPRRHVAAGVVAPVQVGVRHAGREPPTAVEPAMHITVLVKSIRIGQKFLGQQDYGLSR